MFIEPTEIEAVLRIQPRRFGDERGFFSESWNRRALEQAGVFLPEFVQDNHSLSRVVGTVRGLHFQSPPHAQAKLVRCGRGRLFDVAVDIRKGSPSYGKWVGEELSFENCKQLFIPAGFLHGFVTFEPDTEIVYKCSDYYAPDCDGAVRWDSCGIVWPETGAAPILSGKDSAAPALADFDSPFSYEAWDEDTRHGRSGFHRLGGGAPCHVARP
ncbi:dTDP-4-dehydrorhamnose 3,5-epimerase [Sinirhodobacter ferrireducens]|uniref:dTDP-4-dehydrorhamnose 3,5-epimerase n=1 Tax=Paenirhodobacter ferrireducens TaxID=1215032 RepID=A0A443L4Z9_9RHOB|nr:dTDP-4-dehydrorhamnose 3,5-epimerase [Sinirhodobacter ferrireducens]RWR44289.1 dTDP-4-dehydrorhamnose 3,5-epimerase [Sinirhodobacter ferrireducens]